MITLDPRVWVLEVVYGQKTMHLDPVAMFQRDGDDGGVDYYVVSAIGTEWMLGETAGHGVGEVALVVREAVTT